MMLIYIKQHQSKIWSSIHEKSRNTKAEWKKSVAYKKACKLLEQSSDFRKIFTLENFFKYCNYCFTSLQYTPP